MSINKEGGDQWAVSPAGYKGHNKWMNYSGYRIMVGGGRSPFFLNMIAQIKNKMEALVIVVTAKPGKGKTYIALRLAQMLDKRFDPEKQIVYDRLQMLEAISDTSPLSRGQVIVVDEAQFSMSGRNWHEQLQKDLMEQMEAVRSKGLIIIIVTLGVDLLDIIMRKHIVNYRLHVERKGVATVYSYDSHRFTGDEIVRKLGEIRMLLPGWEQCQCLGSCLTCEFSGLRKAKWRRMEKWAEEGFKPCQNLRVRYEFMKKLYVEEKNKASVNKAVVAELKKKPVDRQELTDYLLNMSGTLNTNNRGRWSLETMKIALRVGFPTMTYSNDILDEVRLMAEMQKPDIFKKNR